MSAETLPASNATGDKDLPKRGGSFGTKKALVRRTSGNKLSKGSFLYGKVLGQGAYAKVVHCMHKVNKKEYALKIIQKDFIVREKKTRFVMMERNVLSSLQHPGIVKLSFTFQDERSLFFGMELLRGGEFMDVIEKHRKEKEAKGIKNSALDIPLAQFFLAEFVEAMQFLHDNGIIHRDLKPENALIDSNGHLKISDFGTVKDEKEATRCNTFCGTAAYVSPEVLKDEDASKGADLWAFGCVVFQALVGRIPFNASSEYLMFQLILNHPQTPGFEYPDEIDASVKDLVQQLLVQDPFARIGNRGVPVTFKSETISPYDGPEEGRGYAGLKNHKFFEGVEWASLRSQLSPFSVPKGILKEPDKPSPESASMEHFLDDDEIANATNLSNIDPAESPSSAGPSPAGPSPQTDSSQASPQNAIKRKGSNASHFTAVLSEGEEVLHSGIVHKKRAIFKKRRMLLLVQHGTTRAARLIYLDPDSNEVKGEIAVDLSTKTQTSGPVSFDVTDSKRTTKFIECLSPSAGWIEAINEAKDAIREASGPQ